MSRPYRKETKMKKVLLLLLCAVMLLTLVACGSVKNVQT